MCILTTINSLLSFTDDVDFEWYYWFLYWLRVLSFRSTFEGSDTVLRILNTVELWFESPSCHPCLCIICFIYQHLSGKYCDKTLDTRFPKNCKKTKQTRISLILLIRHILIIKIYSLSWGRWIIIGKVWTRSISV